MKNKQRVIVVTGLGGTWKTYLAKYLSKEMNIVCFHKDLIKAGLYDELNIETNDSYKMLYNLAEYQIENGIDIIIESALWYDTDIELFNKWLSKYDINLYCIVCKVDIKIREKRIKWRERHICHSGADKILLENLGKNEYNYSKLPGKIININTDRPVEELVKKLLEENKF